MRYCGREFSAADLEGFRQFSDELSARLEAYRDEGEEE